MPTPVMVVAGHADMSQRTCRSRYDPIKVGQRVVGDPDLLAALPASYHI